MRNLSRHMAERLGIDESLARRRSGGESARYGRLGVMPMRSLGADRPLLAQSPQRRVVSESTQVYIRFERMQAAQCDCGPLGNLLPLRWRDGTTEPKEAP